MSTPYVEIRDLKKSFDARPVLRNMNMTLYTGQRVALLGANGAGKTTLLRILAGLTSLEEGHITIDGLDLVRHAREIRQKIGFVAHQPYLYDELTALENLLFFARMYAVKQPRERSNALLQRVGLSKKARERASSLSRGQLQRLALARALLHAPTLLLLDEPDTGLDQEGKELLAAVLKEHHSQGGTTLFTTHDLEAAAERSDQIIVLHKGRVAHRQETTNLEPGGIHQTYQEAVR